jgi:hypothetical protein
MNIRKKIALAAIPAVMARSATDGSSKVLLLSDNGWDVSVEGAANAFYHHTSTGSMDTLGYYNEYTQGGETAASTILGGGASGNVNRGGVIGQGEQGSDISSISVGLLPNVWGFTVKAPTKNGLDVSGRLGLYTHMNANGDSADGNLMNIRETSLTVAGSFGSVLMGRSLGIHQSNAILNDMTLFGVGVAAGNISGTTLGRIGVGYVYADWYPQITWTTPGLGPIGAKIGILQATPLQSSTGADATNTKYPRVEAQLDYSFELGGLGGYVWVDGQYQSLERTTAEAQAYQFRNRGLDSNFQLAGQTGNVSDDQADGIEVGGVGFGTRLTFQGFKLVASGFYNHGLGMQFQGNNNGAYSGSLDERGKARHFYGGYIQGTYDFGQGTNIGYSYGSNHLVTTGQDDGEINQRYTLGGAGTQRTDAIQNYVESHMGMIWHNVTDDFRVIAEGVYSEAHWHGAGSQESTQVSVGAFFFW